MGSQGTGTHAATARGLSLRATFCMAAYTIERASPDDLLFEATGPTRALIAVALLDELSTGLAAEAP